MKSVKEALVYLISLFICTSVATVYAANTDGQSIVWGGCGITKKAFMAELAKAYEKKTGIVVDLQGGGATKGIRDAVKGEIDIGGACRPIMEDHKDERHAYQVPVAWDALVVITHPQNPVKTITVPQLQGIYLGKITNWKELGGDDAPIQLFVRRGKYSGVGRTLRELVFANYDQTFTGAAHIVRSSGPLEKGVESNKNGIGVTGISSATRRKVNMLQLNGKSPTYENIKNGSYVLYRPLYLVTRGKLSADKKVKDFITFALSRQGRDVIRKAGSVPYSDAMRLVMKQIEQSNAANDKSRTMASRGN